MPAKGNVDRERWIAKAREQERFIISTGGVNSSATWNERTLANRANLEDWQEDYLVAINYPRDRKEDKQRKNEFRRAKKMRDVATVLEEAKTNGSTLPPYKILRAYNAYGDGIKLGDFVEERALGISLSLRADDRLVKKNMPGRLFFVIAYSYCSHVACTLFCELAGTWRLWIGSPIVGITLGLLLVEGVRSQLGLNYIISILLLL
jgi:hypothetical protein